MFEQVQPLVVALVETEFVEAHHAGSHRVEVIHENNDVAAWTTICSKYISLNY